MLTCQAHPGQVLRHGPRPRQPRVRVPATRAPEHEQEHWKGAGGGRGGSGRVCEGTWGAAGGRGARPTAPCPREVSAPRPLRQPLCRWPCPTAGPAPPGRRTGFSLLVGPLCVGWLCREGGPQPGSRGSGAAHLHLEVLSILRQRSAQFLQGHTETVVDFAGHSALPSQR